jgi:hypothetical protein
MIPKYLSLALLSLVPLACRTSPPSEASSPARTAAAADRTTLLIDRDGSIRAQDVVVYDPKVGDASALQAFAAAQQARDPGSEIHFVAAPDVSLDLIERSAKVAAASLPSGAPVTFKVSGWVQASVRAH